MSFILDALKKSESERSQQSGPVLMDIRVVPPRQTTPAWVWILGVVLLAHLGLLSALLLRRGSANTQQEPQIAAAAPQQAPVLGPAAAPAPAPMALPEPMLPATPVTLPLPLPAAPTAALTNLPTAQDLIASGLPLPPLGLNFHAYTSQPSSRYILLNTEKLREGDISSSGLRLVSVTPEGAVLEWHGRSFLIRAGE
jgi:general secretion pathway protein B